MNIFKHTILQDEEILFKHLIENHKDKLFKIAYMYVKDENEALEIVSESIYKAFINFKKLKNREYFQTWVIRILINCSKDSLKRTVKFIPTIDLYNEEPVKEDFLEYIDLYDAVDTLKGVYKTVIILKYFEDFTIKQIGEIMDISESQVKNYIHKALKLLRGLLKEGELNEGF